MTKVDLDIIRGTCDLHPEALKKFICMEELGELTQAISKVMRDKMTDSSEIDKHEANEIEEIADVMICIKMIQYLDGITDSDIQEWIDQKQRRQMVRDYRYIRDNGMPKSCLDYFYKCKEIANENKLHEKQAQRTISNE